MNKTMSLSWSISSSLVLHCCLWWSLYRQCAQTLHYAWQRLFCVAKYYM